MPVAGKVLSKVGPNPLYNAAIPTIKVILSQLSEDSP